MSMKYTIATIIFAIAASSGYAKCIHETYTRGTYRESYICKDKDNTAELKIRMGHMVEVRTRLFDFHTVTERVTCTDPGPYCGPFTCPDPYTSYQKLVDDSNDNNISYVEDSYPASECVERQRKLINNFKAKWKL